MLSAEPERLAAHADRLRVLDPTYVRSAIEGFQGAVKIGKIVAWDQILTLCEWVVTQPRVIVDRKTTLGDSDPGWTWARTAIARLMLEGVQHEGANSVPIEQGARVWSVIDSVLDDPDPAERVRDGRCSVGVRPHAIALNDVRAAAGRQDPEAE